MKVKFLLDFQSIKHSIEKYFGYKKSKSGS